MYRERASLLPEVIAWQRLAQAGGPPVRVLPDGCLDVIWQDGEVFIAGPDTSARLSAADPGSRFAGLRFAAGTGPGVLGVPADELRDRCIPLADVWHPAAVRRLSDEVAAGGVAALERSVARRFTAPDPVLVAVAAQAGAGTPVGAIAAGCGLSPRHLQRRCTTAFGYGPKLLVRILRLQRAVTLARAGRPFATVAAIGGFADQAHLARDVRALAGVPLGELVGGRAGEPALVVAVRVVHHRVPLPPERVPRRPVTVVTGLHQRGIGGVHLGRIRTAEGEADPSLTLRRLEVGVEAADRLVRVEGQPQPAGQGHLDVRFGVRRGRDLQPEPAVEGECCCHVGHHEADHIE
jgi:AraC-like DNA-binding protein